MCARLGDLDYDNSVRVGIHDGVGGMKFQLRLILAIVIGLLLPGTSRATSVVVAKNAF
jgi:hypothetical protein